MSITNTIIRNKKVAFYQGKLFKFHKINFSDVIHIHSNKEEQGSVIIFNNGLILKSEITLIKFSNILPAIFERVHKSSIININYVDNIDLKNRKIIMNDDTCIDFSRTYAPNLNKYFLVSFEKKKRKTKT